MVGVRPVLHRTSSPRDDAVLAICRTPTSVPATNDISTPSKPASAALWKTADWSSYQLSSQ